MAIISFKRSVIFFHLVDSWILSPKEMKDLCNFLCASRLIVVVSCMLTIISAPAEYSMSKWVPDI